jgi:hypothetical protein
MSFLSAKGIFGALIMAGLMLAGPTQASDHLDTRTVIDDPRADIGDLYAWMSPDGRRLNLAMTMVGHSFSSELVYAFHIDSGPRFGQTASTVRIECRFDASGLASCRLGDRDHLHGVASGPQGIEGRNGEFRVFAGLRDDPFFNNVRGSRDAYQVAAGALARGAAVDGANCASFDRATASSILEKWRQTDSGPGTNFLAGWTPASLIVAVELDEVNRGGPMLAVWATTTNRVRQVDRMGRPLTGNALLAPLAADEVSDTLKDIYNIAAPDEWPRFIPDIAQTLGLYDSFDGECGNQLLADRSAAPAQRYHALAAVLADDRLWVNSASGSCAQFFAVELASLDRQAALASDCGGRTPTQDAVDVYRSLLAMGRISGVGDGVDRDEADHSSAAFPFLAPVQPGASRY